MPYYQDDLTWCVQRAGHFSMIISALFAATPECWLLLIFGIGYTSSFLVYIMIQFDLEYKHRNKRDWHYISILVILPAIIGVNQRFQPKFMPLRMFYGLIILIYVFSWQAIFLLGYRYLKEPIPRTQVSTITEIIYNNYRLSGSSETLSLISFDDRV